MVEAVTNAGGVARMAAHQGPGSPSLRTTEARMLRAEILRDENEWRRQLDLFRAEEVGLEVMQFAFALMARRRFPDSEIEQATKFVNAFNSAVEPGDRLPPREAEGMLRGVLGEYHLADAVDDETAGRVMYTMLLAIIDDMRLTNDEVDELLVVAEAMLEAAENSGAMTGKRGHITDATLIGNGRLFPRMQSKRSPE